MDFPGAFSLSGRTALVTGASRGIGAGVARVLGQAGAHVILTARSAEALNDVAREITDAGGTATAVPADLAAADGIDELLAAAAALGPIDVLVNNAAAHRLSMAGPSHLMSIEDFDTTMDVNVRSLFQLTQRIVRGMIEAGQGGSIVHVTSVAASVGPANLGIYAASKAALATWAQASAAEWGAYGIRVNCVAPGLIETEASRGAWEDPARRAAHEAANCAGRLGHPDDIGWATLYLASPAAAFVTGTTLQVDGGLVVGTMAGDRKPSRRSS